MTISVLLFRGYVTGDTMTRNKVYEDKQKSKGLKKITLWVPEDSEVELKQMASFLCDNRDYIPFMARCLTDGKLKKAV